MIITEPDAGKIRKVRRRSWRPLAIRVAVGIGTCLLVAGLAAGWLVHRAEQVKSNLEAGMGLLPTLQNQLAAGEEDAAKGTLESLRNHTAQARAAGTDPLWKAAAVLPVVGANFSAVSEVSVSADDVVNRAIYPLVDKFGSLDWESLTPANGRIDPGPLQEAAPSLASAANTVQLSYDRLTGIDPSRLLPEVSGPLAQATEALDGARGALNAASSAANVLPGMLGTEGPRNYLVLIQNSAEVRATGGIPGALAVIRADNGAIELTTQSSAGAIEPFRPPLDVDPEQERIFSYRIGAFIQSVNLTPDFPSAAKTAKTMWEERNEGAAIDGVVALDPVVLANILAATGPVELDDPQARQALAGTSLPTALTTENVVKTLLSGVYAEIADPAAQDAYFAAVAAETFGALASGQGESDQLIQSLITSSEQNRLYVWSTQTNEQKVIGETQLAGAATGSTVGGASFGLYFNDGTGAKMDYYVRRTVQLIQTCQNNGYSQFTIRETLTNTAAADAAESLPPYVTGNGAFDVEPGRVRTNHIAYGPAQSLLESARIDGEQVPLGAFRHGNRPVGVVTTELGPGESTTVEVDFSNVVQVSTPQLRFTPTIQPEADVLQPLQTKGPCPATNE